MHQINNIYRSKVKIVGMGVQTFESYELIAGSDVYGMSSEDFFSLDDFRNSKEDEVKGADVPFYPFKFLNVKLAENYRRE